MKTEIAIGCGTIFADLDVVPSDDPLAYVYGFTQGVCGAQKWSGKYLAPEYETGYDHGKSVHDNKNPMPEWAEKRP